MQNWTEDQVRQILAGWLNVVKSPYYNPTANSTIANAGQPNIYEIKGITDVAGIQSRVVLQQNAPDLLEVDIIHCMSVMDGLHSNREVKREFAQFNKLMEAVKLPTYVWLNESNQQFELHWQERLGSRAELMLIKQLFNQSFQLAYCLSTKLDWQYGEEESSAFGSAH
ncbi:MAG: hypothetical protein QE278_04165 [Limnobacter sp.]|nr:hypothetical protein [Limnobacter sp.]